jgi:hypothetical protein
MMHLSAVADLRMNGGLSLNMAETEVMGKSRKRKWCSVLVLKIKLWYFILEPIGNEYA